MLRSLLTFNDFQEFARMMTQECNSKLGINDCGLLAGDESKTGESNWKEVTDPESGAVYYWNELTGETSWDPPDSYQSQQEQEQSLAATSATKKPEGFAEIYTALMNMGFPPDQIVTAMNESKGSANFDELVLKLSQSHNEDGEDDLNLALKLSETHTEGRGEGGEGGDEDAEVVAAELKQTVADYFLTFVESVRTAGTGEEEKASADEAPSLNDAAIELNSKFVMASSVLDTFDEDDDSSEGVVLLLSWAKAMKQLHADIILAYNQGVPYQDFKENYDGGLIEWLKELEQKRGALDENTVAGNIISDAELKRIAELDKIAGAYLSCAPFIVSTYILLHFPFCSDGIGGRAHVA